MLAPLDTGVAVVYAGKLEDEEPEDDDEATSVATGGPGNVYCTGVSKTVGS